MRKLLTISLTGNVLAVLAFVYALHRHGGVQYIGRVAGYHRFRPNPRVEMLNSLPKPDARPVVFLGDSLTENCEWAEIFHRGAVVLNRGIGGETSEQVALRAEGIGELKPIAVFLMAGANDPLPGHHPDETVANVRHIIQRILAQSPDTAVYLQSILPKQEKAFRDWQVPANEGIRKLADGRHLLYLDLAPLFADAAGLLDARDTVDGVHLNARGYRIWADAIRPYVDRYACPLSAANRAQK
jgi:lysophospholipase L1-like esterase